MEPEPISGYGRRGRSEVSVCVEGRGEFALAPETDGYFSGFVADVSAGHRYRFRLDKDDETYPDPASRFQPEGPHGPSEIVDPSTFRWTDSDWHGAMLAGQIVYEMHVGTFTPEGTWESAATRLEWLKEIGITLIEMMPVAEFAGRFGWGYDGVDLFAPTHLYGRPDDLRRLIARAHELGMGVILDVVYNHFGPDGCYLRHYSSDYFTKRYENEWGDAINYDGKNSAPVREFVIANASYWIEEFHFDGLRLDATQSIHDSSSPHILREIAEVARDTSDFRRVVLMAENEPQDTALVRSIADGGYGLDALWNDDFHHSAVVAMTGRNPAYYSDHRGTPQEFISARNTAYLFPGQRYAWQDQPRGTPGFDLSPRSSCCFWKITIRWRIRDEAAAPPMTTPGAGARSPR
jgi:maltooligosyltrehalose trehalohydrolase